MVLPFQTLTGPRVPLPVPFDAMIAHMQELEKLAEARFFLHHLHRQRDVPVEYRYYLSAFLNAARSVLQYAIEENRVTFVRRGKPEKVWASTAAQKWYEGW